MTRGSTRRSFLQSSSSVLAVPAVGAIDPALSAAVHGRGSDEIRIALIGCGGRGTGAVAQIMNTKGNVRLVAVADAFAGNAERAVKNLTRHAEAKVDVPAERMFSGLDAYKKAIDAGADVVVIATPPGFKPQQFEYAVE